MGIAGRERRMALGSTPPQTRLPLMN